MAAPWVILGRVLRVPAAAGAAAEEQAQAAAVDAGAQGEHVAPAVGAEAAAHVAAADAQEEQAEAADAQEEQAQAAPAVAAVPQPDFTIPVVLPPRVTIITTGSGPHRDPEYPDMYPYIVAAGPLTLLAHFAGAPFYGTYFADFPHESHLVLLRYFQTDAAGVTRASAVRVPDRPGAIPILQNIASVGLFSNYDGVYRIAELQVHRDLEHGRLVCFQPAAQHDYADWYVRNVEYPMAGEGRDWAPHGAVTLHSTVWWFDLSWGILSSDLDEAEPDLIFHHVPDGRALAEATPDIHTKRCVTVSRQKLRYVEIIVTEGQAARVCMWTRMIGQDGWNWYIRYAISFESIWNDDSYTQTGLPRSVPELAVVCPSNPDLVYFALGQRLFGVNVPQHKVVHNEAYEMVNMPGPPQPPSGRYIVAWDLPPVVAQALGMDNPFAALHAGQLAAEDAAAQQGLLNDEEDQAGEIEDEEPEAEIINEEPPPVDEIDYAGPQEAVVIEDLRVQQAEIKNDEQQMRRVDLNVAVKMDLEILSRLKAEVKEEFGKGRPGPSHQDPEDDAGEGAV